MSQNSSPVTPTYAPPVSKIVETAVSIAMKNGTCSAAFCYPETGRYPGVLIWPDALGLRDSMCGIARRLAGEGYAVLVPDLYYRVSPKPPLNPSSFNFSDPGDRTKLQPLMASVTAPSHAEEDAASYISFLDDQEVVDKSRQIGTQGYCLGGPLALRTAAARPDRVGAAASFHGGGLVTDKPESPHLLASSLEARLYFAIAANDDERQPEAKDKLKKAFATAGVPAEIEVYPGTLHGWCVPDMPAQNGPVYNEVAAERAWSKLIALYLGSLQ